MDMVPKTFGAGNSALAKVSHYRFGIKKTDSGLRPARAPTVNDRVDARIGPEPQGIEITRTGITFLGPRGLANRQITARRSKRQLCESVVNLRRTTILRERADILMPRLKLFPGREKICPTHPWLAGKSCFVQRREGRTIFQIRGNRANDWLGARFGCSRNDVAQISIKVVINSPKRRLARADLFVD